MNSKIKKLITIGLMATVVALTGCSAMTTAIQKRNLEVKTQMSKTIWLDPSEQKTVYLQIRNTSDKDMGDLPALISQELTKKGYQVVTSADNAYYWIQANVLKADKMDLRAAHSLLTTGYQGAAVGAAIGAGITAYNSGSDGAALGVGLATGLIGAAVDALVQDINYTMVTDLQISTRSKNDVETWDVASLQQGSSGARIQSSIDKGHRAKYQTRIVSNAEKVNLQFEQAKPVLEQQLAKAIAAIFS